MKQMAHSSSRPVQSPGSSPRSGTSASPESPASHPASFPLHPVVEKVNEALSRIRDEDLAKWGAMAIEDLGILDVDRVVGTASAFGALIRADLCSGSSRMNPHWSEVATRLLIHSPASHSPTNLLGTVCLLSASRLFTEGRINASA